MAEPTPANAAPAAAPPPAAAAAAGALRRTRGRWWHACAGVAATLMTLVIAMAAALWWAVGSERGSAWVLSALPGVDVTAPKGALLGDFEAQRVSIRLPGDGGRVLLESAGWRGLRIAQVAGPRWCLITLADLHARRVDVTLARSTSNEPPALPADLQLPVEVDLRSVRVGELHLSALGEAPLRDLQARVHLGANAGAEHRIEQLSLAWDRLHGSGTARIASAAPMVLDVAVSLAQEMPADTAAASAAMSATTATALPAWSAQATLAGPLAEPLLQATVRAQPSAQRAAQALDAQASVRPFARWPLGDVQVRTAALDLSAFSSAAPATALTGQADAKSTGLDQPAHIAIALNNALAGRWNEGRLPLRSLTLDVDGRPDQPGALALRTLAAELGTTLASAGRVTGNGHWTRERWNLDATLQALQPAQLDARAPAMRLNGTLALAGGGPATDNIDVKANLAGTLTERGTARAVQLALDASVSPQRIELRDLQARAGGARASAAGTAIHATAAAPWVLKARTGLVDFDPAVWWPGRDDSAWRKGTTRLNAKATVDVSVSVSVPASFAGRPVAELLNTVRGTAELALADSLLVGVPLSGQGTLQSATGGALVSALSLASAGNQIKLQGRLTAADHGAADAWDLSVDGPALDRLAPVFALFLPPGADTRLGGSLTASSHIAGRWPALTSTGQLDASALRLGNLSLQGAHARWRAGSTANAAVEAELTLQKAASGANAPSVESARLVLQGTGRAHTLSLRAESKALPPAWAEALTPVGAAAAVAASGASPTTMLAPGATAARTVLNLQAQGGLIDGPSATLAGWRGELQQMDLRGEPSAADAKPLLRTQAVGIEVQWAGGPARATVQPGRAEVLGGALRWSRVAWQAASGAGQPARIDAEAELEPLRIAPILARLQPDFGWGGDLTIGGRVLLHSAPTFAADIVIERRSGDLTVTDEVGTQGFGLTDLRLALAAQNGVWNFTQAVAGEALGAGAGAVVMRTSPQAVWPEPETPIEGVFELQVAHLATWGGWVPPGWRIDGALRASASFGGRFGAPQYTGEVVGSQVSVRNFLQGVSVSDGDVAIRLQGSTAHIERFTAKAGSGSVRVEGDASFGEAPRATVTLTAERFQLLGRVDRRIVTSGQAKLRFDARNVAVDGRFDVDEGLIDFSRSDAPELASDVEVVRAPSAAASAAASAQSAAAQAPTLPANTRRDVALDLRVGLGQKLRIHGHGLDTGLRGELRITSPGGRLAVDGTVQAADGTYAAYGQKLSIDRGVIVFNGEVGNPRLDIEATRPNLDLRVGVAVTGTATRPRIRLFSEPELSEMDKLSWLVMGRASDGLGSADTALLQRAALALLSGEGGGLTEQFTKAIGLDELSVRQSDGDVRNTVVSVGKQLSRRWYVGYERGLNATTGSWQLIYRVARRLTLRAQSGEDNSLDVIWTWRWQ